MTTAATDETVLGFDFGERRIGVAVGQTVTRTATPLVTLAARAGQPDWTALERLIRSWQPARLVIGLPSTADGAPHSLAGAIERFGRRLHGRFGLPIAYIDERLSSHAAAAQGVRARGTLDALAASLILETWLAESQPRTERVA